MMAKLDPNSEEFKLQRRRRSIAIAVMLAILVAAFYALTIVKMGPAVFSRTV